MEYFIVAGIVTGAVVVWGFVSAMNTLFSAYGDEEEKEKNKNNKKSILARALEGIAGIVGLVIANVSSNDERDTSLWWRIRAWWRREAYHLRKIAATVRRARREVSGAVPPPQAAVHGEIAWPPEKK